MGQLGCSVDRHLDERKFSEPLPWIGMYIAAASLACGAAMAADAIRGFYHRKFWFPCKYFTFNATTLTLISIASKLTVDLNTPMPRREDQLSKLSSSVLICIVMGNSMPSLGTMEKKELAMNIMALGILVITLIVNIGIQLATGVIYVFWMEHAFIMSLMLLSLLVLSFTAFVVPTTKTCLEIEYKKKHEFAPKVDEIPNENDKPLMENLRECLVRHWIMALTCTPQFVIARSVTCTALSALCILSAVTLAEANLRAHVMLGSFKFCIGESDYKWSIILILVSQCIAVALGTIAPVMRWFAAIIFRCRTRKERSCTQEFKLERYWIQALIQMKEYSLIEPSSTRQFRKFVHDGKSLILNLCIGIQTAIVFTSKVILLICVYFTGQVLLVSVCCKRQLKRFNPNNSIPVNSGTESHPSPMMDLKHFASYLEGEEDLVGAMIDTARDAGDYWMQRAQRKRLKHLMKLLNVSRISERFKGLIEFDNDQVPSLESREPPNSWTLPLVTLASITVALPGISEGVVKDLMYGVNEGIMYTRLIDNSLNAQEDTYNSRKAADFVWVGVELYHRWLDVDLRKLCTQRKSSREVLELLAESAERRFVEYKAVNMNGRLLENPSKWPVTVLAANAMYRISKTISLSYASKGYQITSESLFEAITLMISDILGACLTNLRHVISVKCKCASGKFVEMKTSVLYTAYLLGKREKILELLDNKRPFTLTTCQAAKIDGWRSFLKQETPLPSSESETASSTPSEMYLTIEENLQKHL